MGKYSFGSVRIGYSLLKSHLHYNLHVVDSLRCRCGYPREDPHNFFFNCPIYAPARRFLLESVNLTDLDIHAILYGDFTQELTANNIQLNAIHHFMRDTKRFNYGCPNKRQPRDYPRTTKPKPLVGFVLRVVKVHDLPVSVVW